GPPVTVARLVVRRPCHDPHRPDRLRDPRVPWPGRPQPRPDGGGPVRTELTTRAAPAAAPIAQEGPFMPHAIRVAGLRKSYGSLQAARDISFSVRVGEIVALLRP